MSKMEKLTPKLQRIVDKTSPEIIRKIYFNKKFRLKTLNNFKKLQESSTHLLDSSSNVKTIKEAENRLTAESFLDVSTKYIKFCLKAEREQKYYNQRGEFVLLKKDDTFIFNIKTIRDKKLKEGNLIFKKGLPNNKIKPGVLKKFAINLSGFEKEDNGRYYLKLSDFENGYFHFWGKKNKYFINFKIKGGTLKLININCLRIK